MLTEEEERERKWKKKEKGRKKKERKRKNKERKQTNKQRKQKEQRRKEVKQIQYNILITKYEVCYWKITTSRPSLHGTNSERFGFELEAGMGTCDVKDIQWGECFSIFGLSEYVLSDFRTLCRDQPYREDGLAPRPLPVHAIKDHGDTAQ